MIKATSLESLKEILSHNPVYEAMMRDVPDPKKKEDFKIDAGLRTLGRD
jgi:hypothetical protein